MKRLVVLVFIFQIIIVSMTQAQDADDSTTDVFFKKSLNEAGFVFTMAELGSGFGAFYDFPFGGLFHLGASIDAYFIRDSKQVELADPYTGGVYSINDFNDVYIFNAMITLKRRFFAEDMDDNVRPFLSGGFGPVFGMNFPELPGLRDQYAWTMGGFFGGGVDITIDAHYFVSTRAQYRVIPFSEPIGETSNHSMFELRFEIGRRF